MLPFKLKKGFLFEDCDMLLPWGLNTTQIATHGEPTISHDRSEVVFFWPKATFLGGLSGVVSARMTIKNRLRDIWLRAALPRESAAKTFERVAAHLRGSFGEPTKLTQDEMTKQPIETWFQQPIALWHFIEEGEKQQHLIRVRYRGRIELTRTVRYVRSHPNEL